jgi:deoxyribose-phosphate aldolase
MTADSRQSNIDASIAAAIEYTDLRKEITYRDVEIMCSAATREGFGALVIPSGLVRRAAAGMPASGPLVVTIISHPFGTQNSVVKAREASVAVGHGARELDVIPHFGAIQAERWSDVHKELEAIRSASGSVPLKLVLETGRLRSTQIEEVCRIAADCGFSYISNSVGFRLVSTDPDAEGAASPQIVRMLHESSRGELKIKAVGGISSVQAIHDLLEAGASRVALRVAPENYRSGGSLYRSNKEHP